MNDADLWIDRTTPIGQMIDGYLKSAIEMDDHAIHLLFSANRWEAAYVPSLSHTPHRSAHPRRFPVTAVSNHHP